MLFLACISSLRLGASAEKSVGHLWFGIEPRKVGKVSES